MRKVIETPGGDDDLDYLRGCAARQVGMLIGELEAMLAAANAAREAIESGAATPLRRAVRTLDQHAGSRWRRLQVGGRTSELHDLLDMLKDRRAVVH
jgi:hypothetical protein